MHKVDNYGIFVLLKFENKLDAAISDINFILKVEIYSSCYNSHFIFIRTCTKIATLPTL